MGRRRKILGGRKRKGGPIETAFVIWLFGGIFLGGFNHFWGYISVPIAGIGLFLISTLIIKNINESNQLKDEQKASEERLKALDFRLEEERKLMKGLSSANIDSMDGFMFEKYVSFLLEHRGFKTFITKGSGDHGVDIVAFKDNQRYSVQVKRHNSNVSRTAVSDAVAGKDFYDCDIAMVITNSNFSPAAIKYAEKTNCVLVNRELLAEWINDFHEPDTFKDYFLKS